MPNRGDYKLDDPELRAAFLLAYERSGEVLPAAAAVGINRATVYEQQKRDPEFVADMERAKGRLLEKGLQTAKTLGLDGVVVKHYDKEGNVIKEETKYSERILLRFLERHLKEWRPGIEVDKKVTEQKTIDIRAMSSEDKAQLRDLLLRNRLSEPSEN